VNSLVALKYERWDEEIIGRVHLSLYFFGPCRPSLAIRKLLERNIFNVQPE
jgi:hypothetical protein